jgi:hypothetical protein
MLSPQFPDGASPSTESLHDVRETKVKSWTLENRSQFSVPENLIIATGRGATPMPSPFPGMNPFLEQDDAWHDFHEKIIPKIAEQLVVQVRPEYIVKIDEHIYVHELPAEPRRYLGRADVFVSRSEEASTAARSGISLLEAPTEVQLPVHDVERLAFVEIRDRRSRELVTVIEVLSPSNKQSGSSRDQYLAKRQELLDSKASLVEIDLLRGGKPMPLDDLPDRAYAYSVLVSRVEDRPKAGFWSIGLRDRLPIIPVPLRAPANDARLDLQEALNHVYDVSGYEDYIYSGVPDPPLDGKDQDWAENLIPRLKP